MLSYWPKPRAFSASHYHCPIRPLHAADDPFRSFGQQLWGDLVYVRDFTRLDDLPADKLLKMAVGVHELYRATDLCGVILLAYDRKVGSDFWRAYMAAATGSMPAHRPD